MSERARILTELAHLRLAVDAVSAQLTRVTSEVEKLDEYEWVEERSSAGASQVQVTEKVSFPAAVVPKAKAGSLVAAAASSRGYSGADIPSDFEKEEAAKETGRFFLRCCRGENRGNSGRGRIKLPNHFYVLVKSFTGQLYHEPVRVFRSYQEIRPLVSDPHTGKFGDSVFAGFNSQWEAQVAVAEAGYGWPAPGEW